MTKTEEYLRILAEGGDAPTDCCMTVTQSLIAQAIDRINNLGGGGAVVPLSDFADPQTGMVTDTNKLAEAINAGKAFYASAEMMPAWGVIGEGIYNGSIDNGVITLSGSPVIRATNNGGQIAAISLHFDATTGMPTPNALSAVGFNLPIVTNAPEGTLLSLGKLIFHSYDGFEDEYDGSNKNAIDIYLPKEIRFYATVGSSSGASSGDDSALAIWADFRDYAAGGLSSTGQLTRNGAYDFKLLVQAIFSSSLRSEFNGRVNGGQFAYDEDTDTATVIFSVYDEVATQYKTYKLTCTESSVTDGNGNTLTDYHWEIL